MSCHETLCFRNTSGRSALSDRLTLRHAPAGGELVFQKHKRPFRGRFVPSLEETGA